MFSKMEDDLNFFKDQKRPNFFQKWKTKSIFSKMEEDPNLFEKGRRPQLFSNGKQPQHLIECKMTSIFLLMEDDL
jgi:hypothetical protein